MKRFLAIALIGTVGLIYSAGSASAVTTGTIGAGMNKIDGYADGLSANGIGSSRHNLGIFGMHTITGWDTDGDDADEIIGASTAGTSEICVFCHTPHHTRDANTIGPLWNRGETYSTFIPYAGTIGDALTSVIGYDNNDYAPGPASVACMSCHDGVTKFDMLVNGPGMTDDADLTWDTGGIFSVASIGWTFREKTGSIFGDESRLSIGATTAGVAGNDLSNDHPVGMEYRGGEVASLRLPTINIASIDLVAGAFDMQHEHSNRHGLAGGEDGGGARAFDNSNLDQNRWAVYGFINTAATIQDILKGSGADATVECGSCHDPHFNNKSWGENDGNTTMLMAGSMDHSNGLFLRRVGGNAGSGVCRTCHDK